MRVIDCILLKKLSEEAKSHPRRRKNFNFHQSLSDPINRMLNALEPGTYVRPHKHSNPDKREVFLILKGRVAVFIFDDSGKISNSIILDNNTGHYAAEINPGEWHSIAALEPGSVVYEVKDGPYNPADDKNFAPWAPNEESNEAKQYLEKLLSTL